MDPLSEYYFQPEEEEYCGIKIPSIIDDYVENYSSVVDRFFKKYYYIKPEKPDEQFLVLFHSNRVCLICLAPQHEALVKGVKSVTFDIGNTDRSLNHVKGKGKKGGMILQEDSTLAIITAEDGANYKVPSCIKGKLLEVNERILKSPELLSKEGDGYLAVVLPKPENCDQIKSSLLTEEQYVSNLKQ